MSIENNTNEDMNNYDKELELWKKFKETNDPEIRNQIIMKYSYLVKCIALQLRGVYKQFADVDDIINEGIITLIDAVNKYDLNKSTKFGTYATIRIRGSIIDYVRKQDWVPRRVKKLAKEIDEIESKLRLDLNRDPTPLEISNKLNISVDEYNKRLSETHSVNVLSYEQVLTDKLTDGIEIKNSDVPNEVSPEKYMDNIELKQVLAQSIDNLTERERIIISLYYYEELKLKEISKILEVSESRVCQIHSNAVKKLRNQLSKYMKS